MYRTLTVAIPDHLREAVTSICVAIGIMDNTSAMPPPRWQGHGDTWCVLSGQETGDRVNALLTAATAAGIPLLVLTPQTDEDGEPLPAPAPEAGRVLAIAGPDGLNAVARMGLTMMATDEDDDD